MEQAIVNFLGRLDAAAKREVCLHAYGIFLSIIEPIAAGACLAAPEACAQIYEVAGAVALAAANDFVARECR